MSFNQNLLATSQPGVSSINNLTGAVTLQAGTGMKISQLSGNTLLLDASGSIGPEGPTGPVGPAGATGPGILARPAGGYMSKKNSSRTILPFFTV